MDLAAAALTPIADPDAEARLDARLLTAAREGDGRAVAQLVDRHLGAVHRFAWRQLGESSEAEDVAQEVFLRLWQRRGVWQAVGARLRTWLLEVTRNLCVDRLRQRRATVAPEDVALVDDGADLQGRLEQVHVAQDLRTALAALPERQRAAIALVHDEGLEQAAAAQVLGVSVDALESLLARARRTLRTQLLGHGNGERAR